MKKKKLKKDSTSKRKKNIRSAARRVVYEERDFSILSTIIENEKRENPLNI